jgi:hypothetical protein
MNNILSYIQIIGELGAQKDVYPKDIISDLLCIDTLATKYIQSGIKDLSEDYVWEEFLYNLNMILQTDIGKAFIICLHDKMSNIAKPNILQDLSLFSENIVEIEVDLSHYSSVNEKEINKLITIIENKYTSRFIILSVLHPHGNKTTSYISTYKNKKPVRKDISELDTLLSLYLEINSGDQYE